METTTKVVRRPFHETIVETIRNARSTDEICHLVLLIEATKIPKDHDKIIAAVNEEWSHYSHERCRLAVSEVKVILLEQRAEAEAEVAEKARQKTAGGQSA